MKKLYYVSALCLIFALGFANDLQAQAGIAVGLKNDNVRMTDHVHLKTMHLAPAYLKVDMASRSAASFSKPMMDSPAQTIGGGLIYGSEIEKLGLQLTYFYFLTAAIAIGGDFSFFFPQEFFGITNTFMTVNVLAHYIFYNSLAFRTYVIAGLLLAIERVKFSSDFGSGNESFTEIGFNLGAGIEYALATGFLYLEVMYSRAFFGQVVLALGYRHVLGGR